MNFLFSKNEASRGHEMEGRTLHPQFRGKILVCDASAQPQNCCAKIQNGALQ